MTPEEIQKFTDDLSALNKENEALKGDNAALQAKADKFQEAFERSQAKLSEANIKNAKLKEELHKQGIPFSPTLIIGGSDGK